MKVIDFLYQINKNLMKIASKNDQKMTKKVTFLKKNDPQIRSKMTKMTKMSKNGKMAPK